MILRAMSSRHLRNSAKHSWLLSYLKKSFSVTNTKRVEIPEFAAFEVPSHLVAQKPAEPPDDARLMVVDRSTGNIEHGYKFRDLPSLLDGSYTMVVNDAKVDDCKFDVLLGGNANGHADTETIYLQHDDTLSANDQSRQEGTFVFSGKGLDKIPLHQQLRLVNAPGCKLSIQVLERLSSETVMVRVSLEGASNESSSLLDVMRDAAQVPLPPYICSREGGHQYQTVFAKSDGSIAAPAAALHFTEALLDELNKHKGFRKEEITLNIGNGTFAEVDFTQDLSNHRIPTESYYINYPTAGRLDADWETPNRKIVAVGTTVARALESAAIQGTYRFESQSLAAGKDLTDLFIAPGYHFCIVDAMITNFHVPGLYPLSVVAAFMGPDLTKRVYDQAIQEEYRFYCFGDAMLIR